MSMTTTKRVTSSPYYAEAVKKVQDGCSRDMLYKWFRDDKKWTVSKKVVTLFLQEVRGNPNESHLVQAKAMEIIDELEKETKDRQLGKVLSVITRRGKLLKEISSRIKIVKAAQERESLAKVIVLEIQKLSAEVEQIMSQDDIKILKESGKRVQGSLKYLDALLRENISKFGIRADLEGVLQRYYQSVHENYKYVEGWITKYEIKKLIERTAITVSKSAMEKLVVHIPTEKKELAIKEFKTEMIKALTEMSDSEISVGEEDAI
ncbi:hypothetical protein [Methylobacter sp.]|uniref:hypothetical protein n=1 Tax=Methylobacter sp. TaxID=2051955 RepID=UPI0011F8AB87|nr:hypothetical protein [Methylobacter sp.]TAK59561.1 MAG: hypothetical protein EPO18_20585 [Methylobacter sp.]